MIETIWEGHIPIDRKKTLKEWETLGTILILIVYGIPHLLQVVLTFI